MRLGGGGVLDLMTEPYTAKGICKVFHYEVGGEGVKNTWIQHYVIQERSLKKNFCTEMETRYKIGAGSVCVFPKFVTSGSGLGSGFSKIQVWV